MPVAISISDVPVAPVALSFVSEPTPPGVQPGRGRIEQASRARRLAGWSADLALLALLFSVHLVLAIRIAGDPRSALGILLAAPWLWLALGAGLAVAWSWVFVALWGRTPGMALTGQRLRLLRGGAPTPVGAFVRAVLAVLSGGPAFFGFALGLFDPRGQTLQDKLCGCVAVVD